MRDFAKRIQAPTTEGGGRKPVALLGLLAISIIAAYVALVSQLAPRDRLISFAPGKSVVYIHEQGPVSALMPLMDPLSIGGSEQARFAVKAADGRLSWATIVRSARPANNARLIPSEYEGVQITKDVFAYGSTDAVSALKETVSGHASLLQRETTARALRNVTDLFSFQFYISYSALSNPEEIFALPKGQALVGGINRTGHLIRILPETTAAKSVTNFVNGITAHDNIEGVPSTNWDSILPGGVINPMAIIDPQAAIAMGQPGTIPTEATVELLSILNQPIHVSLFTRPDGTSGFMLRLPKASLHQAESLWLNWLAESSPTATRLILPDNNIAIELKRGQRFFFADKDGWRQLSDHEGKKNTLELSLKQDKDGLLLTNYPKFVDNLVHLSKNPSCHPTSDYNLWISSEVSSVLAKALGLGNLFNSITSHSLNIFSRGDNDLLICG